MDDFLVCKILAYKKVVLRITSRKELTMNNMFHTSNIQKNMVFSSLLSKNEFTLVF